VSIAALALALWVGTLAVQRHRDHPRSDQL